ncbi:hypothetical protein HZB02_05470 [Candidatus Woesearchaeota archaeon]|nr:hypothetical protein [Candidatus Woesearchaeota archaeon]
MELLFTVIGVLGILCITIGIITRRRKNEDVYYIVGGICLILYSISKKDAIFIIFQSIAVTAAVYDFFRTDQRKPRE